MSDEPCGAPICDERGKALLALARAVEASGYRFTTVTPATHALVNARVGNEWATDLAGVFGWSRPFQPGVLPPDLFELMQQAGVAVPHGEGWRALVRLSSLGDRLFIHSAFPTTAADAVFFGPDTYRFASALRRHLDARSGAIRRAVDIGCGAGAGAILIALRHPQAEVLAVDINDEALRLGAVNAELAGASNIRFESSDLLTAVEGEFDLITANPPYLLDASERAYRHGGGDLGEGLSLAIVRAALERLAPGGTLVLYTGVAIVQGIDRFRSAVGDLLANAHVEWDYAELDPDVFGEELRELAYRNTERIAAVLLTLTRIGSGDLRE